MSNPLFPSEILVNVPESVSPTLFSVGRPVGGGIASRLLSTDENGRLVTTINPATSYQPLDSTLTALAGLNASAGYLKQTGVDAFVKSATIPFSDLSSTPTTLAGYGITDAQGLDATLTALAGLNGDLGAVFQTGTDTFVKKTFSGTANEIIITETASGLTFATPQDIHTAATPTFGGLTLTNQIATRLIFAGTGGGLIQSSNLTFNNSTNVFTVTNGQANISRNDGGGNFALDVSHGGGSASRMAARIATTGTNSNTTALIVNTGAQSNALMVDGAGNTGFGQAAPVNIRVGITGQGNTSSTDALRIINSDGVMTFQARNDGFCGIGALSAGFRFNVSQSGSDLAVGAAQFSTNPVLTDGTARTINGLQNNLVATIQNTVAHPLRGSYTAVRDTRVAAGVVSTATLVGSYIDARLASASHLGTLGTLFAGYNLYGSTAAAGSGSITTQAGLFLQADYAGGPVTNSYALYMGSQGTTNIPSNLWGIYETHPQNQNLANYFANPVQIGTVSKGGNFVLNRTNSGSAWGASGINMRLSSSTFTDTSTASGSTVAYNVINSFAGGVLAALNNSVNYTHGINQYLAVPTAGANATIQNPWTLWVHTGATKTDNIFIAPNVTTFETHTNSNLLSGSGWTGMQIRLGSSRVPAIEMFSPSNSVANGGTLGKLSWWAGATTPRENAKIESLQVGATEDAADIVISTATGGVLTERIRVQSTGRTVIQQLNEPTAFTPASATAAGVQGDIAWDANYIYVCVASNQWKRSPLASW